jgi:hypothetical protein
MGFSKETQGNSSDSSLGSFGTAKTPKGTYLWAENTLGREKNVESGAERRNMAT